MIDSDMDYSYFLVLPTVLFLTGVFCHYFELAGYFVKDKARGKGDVHYHYGIIPFLNPYGIAGVLLYLVVRDFPPVNDYLFIVLSFFLSGLIEIFAGVLSEKILKKKLWSYSTVRFNILGYTTPFHMVKWALLSLFAEKIVYPYFLTLVERFNQVFSILDLIFVVIMIVTILSSIRKPLYSNYFIK